MKELLKDFDKKKVDVFINYLSELEKETKGGKKVNYWYSNISKDEFAGVFKKVASEGLFIDGDTITLNYLKKLVITYDYHAYQNKVKAIYPETVFDFGVVYKGDSFSFKKESGKVLYNHELSDPFNTEKEIIGGYGIIKNTKGEFLETINMDDINKMKKSSKMAFIWNTWLDRMVLKSVIKRICKIHFKDEVQNLENEDNEQYDIEVFEPDLELYDNISKAETIDELTMCYDAFLSEAIDKKVFIKKLGERKKEIKESIIKQKELYNDKNS